MSEIKETGMKALSLTQPMAWAIFHGKDVENRTRRTNLRGRVYIHASRGFNREHYRWIVENDNRLVTGGVPFPEEFVHGAIIGKVDIVDCVKNSTSRWAITGQHHYILANPIPYADPLPCKGTIFPLFFEPDITFKMLDKIGG